MNFYNPYYSFIPYSMPETKIGLFRSLFGSGGRFSLGSIISGTQKTLGVINQAIPVIKQVSPVVKNAKTIFKVMNEFKKTDSPKANSNTKNNNTGSTNNSAAENETIENETIENNSEKNNGPTFFI